MKADYKQQAVDFLTSTNTKFQADFLKWGKHFDDDKEGRDIYEITLQRGRLKYTFNFGQSIRNSCKWEPPAAYDVLACLTKYDPGHFSDFCDEFGFRIDPHDAETTFRAMGTYKAVNKEFQMVCALWNEEELEKLREIQ